MDLAALDQSKYLGKNDIPDDGIILTIASFDMVQMKNSEPDKLCIHWREPGMKPMLVNKTNRTRLRSMFRTDESRNMIGKQIGIWNDPNVEYGGQVVGGLRIRAVVQPQFQPAEQQPPVPNAAPAAAPAAPGPDPALKAKLAAGGFDDDIPF
ncbi:MAG: hypothetical protein OEV88_17100 [Gammaproteobacteria bacterium]|nr:hypothetical protein [Gammaproteobacteria bacterium]